MTALKAHEVERFFPGRFAKDFHDPLRVHRHVGPLGHAGPPDQRLGQALRMMRVIEAVASLDAQAAMIGRPIASFDIDEPFCDIASFCAYAPVASVAKAATQAAISTFFMTSLQNMGLRSRIDGRRRGK